MTKAHWEKLPKEVTICGQTFLTIYGICEKIEGRTKGSHLSLKQMLQYVKEGAPCFEHAGSLVFEKDLSSFLEWLRQRRPMRQIKAQERMRKIYAR